VASAESFFVTRTMQALEALAFEPCTAPELASLLRVDARTARRLLRRLADEGWLTTRSSGGRARIYAPSMRVLALAAHLAERLPLARAAVPAVDKLHEATGATAHLTVPSYRSVLCLVHRAGSVDARPHLRELVPAHACAGGKVLLAHREPWRESVLAVELEALTERTIVDPAEIREQCLAIRENGFAVEDGEYRDDLQGIAAPVHHGDGEVLAAVALTGARDLDVTERRELVAAAVAEMEATLEAGAA
jgi:IclR family transcriptional regulator, KDG regulon repressor